MTTRDAAEAHLRALAGDGAVLREDQWTAIDALVSGDHRWVQPGDRFDATFTIAVPAADPPSVRDLVGDRDRDLDDVPPP